jgi:hypothetical protein
MNFGFNKGVLMNIPRKCLIYSAVIGMVLVFILTRLSDTAVPSNYSFNSPMNIGSKEDPDARAQFDFKRLRSPISGKIPGGIRSKELKFASKIPSKELVLRQSALKGENTFGMQEFTWERVGPHNVGGRTRALAIDVSDITEGTLLAGGVSGGVWRYTADPQKWEKMTHPSDLHNVTTIAQDTRPGKTNIWYFGTGEFRGNTATDASGDAFFLGDGIFKSIDGGSIWEQLSATASETPHIFESSPGFDMVWKVIVDISNLTDDVVYAATYGAIRKSSDGGQTWSTKVGTISNPSSYTDVAVTSSGVVYATLSSESDSSGIWRSDDGETWMEITPDNFPGIYRRTVIGIAPSEENVVYFLVNAPGSGKLDHGIWKYTYLSGDGTGSEGQWDDRTDNIPEFGGLAGDFDSQGSYDLAIKVKPDDPDVVFIGGTNLYRSTDGFASVGNSSWIGGYQNVNDFVKVNNHHPDIHEIIFSPSDPLVMYTGTDGGVSRTVNDLAANVTWESFNKGYYTTQFFTVGIVPGIPGSNIIIGGMQDNGTYFFNSDISVADWVEVFSGDGAFNAISRDGTHYYISAQGGLTFRFDLNLNGAVISNKLGRIDMGGNGFLFINPFILNPNDDKMMFMVRGDELWRNSNVLNIPMIPSDSPTQTNWITMTNAQFPGEVISALTMTETPENRLYYGTDKNRVVKIENADQGNPEPIDISSPDFSSGAYVSSIAADPVDGDNVMVTFSNYQVKSLFFSGNGGSAWTDVGGNLEENTNGAGNGPSVRWAYIHHTGPESDPVYFVGTSTGLYSTTVLNGADTQWVQEGAAAIGNIVVDMIVGRNSDGVVVVATHGGGVYKSTIVTAVEDDITAIPSLFELEQNYPNPFNPETTISFTLDSSIQVTLKIYNALGQEVRTLLAREERSAGGHKELFDGRTDTGIPLSSGIYFYRLEAGKFSAIKKMILVK